MTDAANPGWADLHDLASETNSIKFFIRQAMAEASHITIVAVKAVHGGGIAAPPTVDVQPLVAQIDQTGKAQVHDTISGLPTMRIQAGANAIVIDPQVGDIGVAVFADRDISSAVKNQAPANPGSWRRFDWADGIYLYSIGHVVPTQYLQVTDDVINIVANNNPINITTGGGDCTIDSGGGDVDITTGGGDVDVSAGGGDVNVSGGGDINVTGGGDVLAGSISLLNHHHTGVTTGSGNTGGPA